MEIRRHVDIDASPATVFPLVDDLAAYPSWMELIHEVGAADESAPDRPAWEVELRAQVGPLARSKRLRMMRTQYRPDRRVVFERAEVDGRVHSPWVLVVDLETPPPAGERAGLGSDATASSTRVTMTLTYGGSLWSGAVLERVLDDHVERGADALRAIATAR